MAFTTSSCCISPRPKGALYRFDPDSPAALAAALPWRLSQEVTELLRLREPLVMKPDGCSDTWTGETRHVTSLSMNT